MNNYHIYEKIGQGKHSTVYKGRKKKTIQYYAIKSVDKNQKNRVLQEVRTMHALDHKNILKFYAWYETTNHLWLILEYCVGGDLMSLLRQDVRLPESSVHDFARDLMVALQHLHSKEIIYCDLKPSNTLLDENGRLKLGGFGLSRRLSDINKKPVAQLPQAMRGTPCYMAPELFSDAATHSMGSDLWSLGCMLYECSMGRPPFMNPSFNQLVHDILHADPQPIPGATAEYHDLLMRLLDKNPATRIKWRELVVHPFWQAKIQLLDLPTEPAFDAMVARFGCAPTEQEIRMSLSQGLKLDKSKAMRQSVDITRLSRIALSNLEKEGDGSDYTAAEARAGDIRIESADAELDFEEAGEEAVDEETPASPAPGSSDDGMVIDQGSATPMDAGRMINAAAGDAMRAAQAKAAQGGPRGGAAEAAGSRPATRGNVEDPAAPASTSGRPGVGSAGAGAAGAAGAGGAGMLDAGEDDLMQTGVFAGELLSGVEALIWHPSDSAVKPIVANRRIERLPEPRFDAASLPFKPWSLPEMLAAGQNELETFLTHIYRAIASAAPLKDKVNVLSYFETLCVDTNAANVLINSSLTILFIRMLRNARAPTLRIRLASVLGLLVRHATYIAEELANTQVVEVLSEALKDKNERVRRRVMATLGELLFYIATQQQDTASTASASDAAATWGITSNTLAMVARLLKDKEDEVAQHYAVKTVENICSQGGEWAARFANQDVVFNLVQIYNASAKAGGEHLKATTASTLARLLRHSPPLVAYMIDKFGVRLMVAGLGDTSSKVQTAAVNMLNLALAQPDLSMRAKAALGEERSLVPALVGLLDHSLPLMRAKGVVAILLLGRLSTRWLLDACKAKLVPAIERLARDKDEYVASAIAALRSEMSRFVPAISTQINEELRGGRRNSAGPGGAAPSPSAARPASKSPLLQFPVLLHLTTSPYFRQYTVTPQLITDLAGWLTSTAGSGGAAHAQASAAAATGMADFKANLMHVLEAICQQAEIVVAHHKELLGSLLPALCAVVSAPGETGDTRFFCLRMVSDVLQMFLADPELYGQPQGQKGSAGGAKAAPSGAAAAAIDGVLRSHILPLVPQLLRDEDPMPLYALKLLGGLLEVNLSYVRDVEAMGLAGQFFEFLSLEHSNNNVHNIRLCRQIIAAGSMPVEELVRMTVSEKVAAVLEYASSNNVEPFLEPVLELTHTILQRDAMEAEAGRSDGALSSVFLDQAPVLLENCSHPDAAVSNAAAVCTTALVAMYPAQCAPWLMSPESLALVVSVLSGEHLAGQAGQASASAAASAAAGQLSPQVQQYLLDAVATALEVPGAVQGPSDELMQLYDILRHLSASGDQAVRGMATELINELATVLH